MPFNATILDTAAHRVIKQMVDHSWDLDESLEEEDIININLTFQKLGGSWESLMDGDIQMLNMLENSIECWLNSKPLLQIAQNIVDSYGS